MITISGLTARQLAMMELLWACDTLDQVTALITALPTADQPDARSLVLIATQDSIEQELGLDSYKDQADAIIHSCR